MARISRSPTRAVSTRGWGRSGSRVTSRSGVLESGVQMLFVGGRRLGLFNHGIRLGISDQVVFPKLLALLYALAC